MNVPALVEESTTKWEMGVNVLLTDNNLSKQNNRLCIA